MKYHGLNNCNLLFSNRKSLKLLFWVTFVLTIAFSATGQNAIKTIQISTKTVNDTMKNMVDFFHPNALLDTGALIDSLFPRYYVSAGNRANPRTKIRYFPPYKEGVIRTASFSGMHDTTQIKPLVDTCKVLGINHYELWTEPNRVWGPPDIRGDHWLRVRDWKSFCHHAADIYRIAHSIDSTLIFHGPVVTSDSRIGKDPYWLKHLTEFVSVWNEKKYKLDYITINPPYEPEDVLTISSFAHGISKAYPHLQVKGISLGEYPYYIDTLSRNIRFLATFEELDNILYAARSHFRDGKTNSGLITEDNKTKAIYWVYWIYARQKGFHLQTSTSSRDSVCAIAHSSFTKDTIGILLANDLFKDIDLKFQFDKLWDSYQSEIYRFTPEGLKLVESSRFKNPNNRTIMIKNLEAQGARYIKLIQLKKGN